MIKNLFSTTAIILLACQANAQITLTEQTSSLQDGDSFEFTNHTEPTIGNLESQSGANQTWDYSNISGGTILNQSIDFENASNLSHFSHFPDANIGISSTSAAGGDSENFFKNSSTGVEFVGIALTGGGNTNLSKLTEGFFLIKFPMTYNTSYTDSIKGTSSTLGQSGSEFERLGISEMMGDGYGDLILPYGTVHDVLRVKTERTYSDYFGGSPLLNYIETTYHYYVDYSNMSIAQYSILSANGLDVQNSFSYRTQATFPNIGIENFTPNQEAQVYPNPAFSSISISNIAENTSVSILDIQGKLIKQQTINPNSSINIDDLKSGLYFATILDNDKLKTIKFIKQ